MGGPRNIDDDAGQKVPAFDVLTIGRTGDPELRSLVGRLEVHRTMGNTGASREHLVFMAAMFVGQGLGAAAFIAGLPLWFAAVPMLGSLAGAMWWRARRAAKSTSEALVQHGRCGSCGYDITALPPDAQGLSTCAECGAAWRADRIRFPIAAGGSTSPAPNPLNMRAVLRDRRGQIVSAAAPNIPGAEAWLGESTKIVRGVLWRRLLGLRIAMTALNLIFLTSGVAMVAGPLLRLNQGAGPATVTSQMPTAYWPVLFVGGAASVVLGLAMIVLIWWGSNPWISRRAAAILLEEGLCPSCARKLTPADGGESECGPCGTRWGRTLRENP